MTRQLFGKLVLMAIAVSSAAYLAPKTLRADPVGSPYACGIVGCYNIAHNCPCNTLGVGDCNEWLCGGEGFIMCCQE